MEPNYPGIPQYTAPQPVKEPQRRGRRKINIEYIQDKSRRQITFSKRKAGIMKKAYELATLTGTQVLLLVASESGHVYTFATPKLQPLITEQEGKNLIQNCLNAPSTNSEPDNNNEQDSPVNANRYMQSYKNTKREREPPEEEDEEEEEEPDPGLPRLKTEHKISDFAPQGNYPLGASGVPPPFSPSYLNPQNLYGGRQMPPVGLPPPSHHSSGSFVPNSHPGLVGPPPNFPPYGYSHSSQPTQQYNNPANNYLMRPMLPLSSSLGDMAHPSHGSMPGHGIRRQENDDEDDEDDDGDED